MRTSPLPRVRILGILGSLGAKSVNFELLRAAGSLAPEGVELIVFDGLAALPFFDPDLDPDQVPTSVHSFRRAIADSDALLIASPEYGHSLPGVLKNAIDWTIGSGELERKVVAITAAVPHPDRGRLGLAALRQTLGAVSAVIVSDEPIVRGPESVDAIRKLIVRLADAARRGGL